MDWKDYLADSSRNLRATAAAEPETTAAFSALAKAALAEGAVTTKNKELICLAIGIVKQCDDCIGFHVRAAIRAGATRDEISAVIGICIYMGGGPAYMYGARALEAFDQLSA